MKDSSGADHIARDGLPRAGIDRLAALEAIAFSGDTGKPDTKVASVQLHETHAQHAVGIVRICPGAELLQIRQAISIRVRARSALRRIGRAEVMDFPCIGQSIAIAVGVGIHVEKRADPEVASRIDRRQRNALARFGYRNRAGPGAVCKIGYCGGRDNDRHHSVAFDQFNLVPRGLRTVEVIEVERGHIVQEQVVKGEIGGDNLAVHRARDSPSDPIEAQ